MKKPVIYLGLPRGSDLVHFGASKAFWHPTAKRLRTLHSSPSSSCVQQTHNMFWSEMLNLREKYGVTHAAMIHADVIPEAGAENGEGWLDTLYAELEKCGGDLISAVIPIKDSCGLTSTGIDEFGASRPDLWAVRRLTMTEACARPETFTDPALVTNTGLWLCKIGPWCERVHFRIQNRIMRLKDGTFVPQMFSEDWDFARMAKAAGAKLWATRAVKVQHEYPQFHNSAPWGEWATDKAFEMCKKELAELEAERATERALEGAAA